ncbi:hypothetical protein EVAR_49936_1 [Eumeta japonica]|uniref:Uncharacterized protein n=1 Tax=Eumeta variegata TaxID=151549 RepID=A0A4C1XST6_EUMVA|nr:hypothetical protein EVAR_49936_1 [Eumeta japonica]
MAIVHVPFSCPTGRRAEGAERACAASMRLGLVRNIALEPMTEHETILFCIHHLRIYYLGSRVSCSAQYFPAGPHPGRAHLLYHAPGERFSIHMQLYWRKPITMTSKKPQQMANRNLCRFPAVKGSRALRGTDEYTVHCNTISNTCKHFLSFAHSDPSHDTLKI